MSDENPSKDSGNSLMLRTFPGAIWWTRQKNGSFSFQSFILGGQGSGKNDAAEVAQRISSRAGDNLPTLIFELKRLGWQDVLDQLARMENASKVDKISSLKKDAENLRRFVDDHRGWSYEQFREKVYDDLKKSGGENFNEEDVSVRRMHYAATSMMGASEQLGEIEKTLKNLEDSADDSFEK